MIPPVIVRSDSVHLSSSSLCRKLSRSGTRRKRCYYDYLICDLILICIIRSRTIPSPRLGNEKRDSAQHNRNFTSRARMESLSNTKTDERGGVLSSLRCAAITVRLKRAGQSCGLIFRANRQPVLNDNVEITRLRAVFSARKNSACGFEMIWI
jgi:hypothetical protein